MGDLERADRLDDADHLGDDLVGLDHFDPGALAADAEALTLADVAEGGALHRRALELYGTEDGNGRDRRGGTAPLDMVELCRRTLVLPLEGIAGTCGMMAGDRSGLCVGGVVVGHDKAVDGIGVAHEGLVCRIARHTERPPIDDGLDVLACGHGDQLMLHGMESLLAEEVHTAAPRWQLLVGMDERERNPLQVARLDFKGILEREGTGGEVARVGVFLVAFHIELLKVGIADHTLTAHYQMALIADRGQYAADGTGQMGNVGTDVSVATGDDLREPSVVVGHHEGEAVELPGDPDGPSLGPFGNVLGLLGLGQREGGIFVRLLLAGDAVFRHFVCGRAVEHFSCGLLQLLELVEGGIPFVVAHQLPAPVVVSVGGFVESLYELLHAQPLIVCHHIVFLHFVQIYEKILEGRG